MKNVVRTLRGQAYRLSRGSILVVAASVLAMCILTGRAVAQAPTGTSFCEPFPADCPCSNPPATHGTGCDNFGNHTGGALLTATGVASVNPANDTLLFTSAGENNTSFSIFVQGTAMTSFTSFGAGTRCVAGILKRMYTGIASSGTLQRPAPFDLDVATRSATPPGPLDPLSPGDTRYYFVYYRDPMASGPCGNQASTFNSTQAIEIHWQP